MSRLIDKILSKRAGRILRRHGRTIRRNRNKIIIMSLIKPLCFFLLESDAPNKNYAQEINYQTKIEISETSKDSLKYSCPSTINLKNYKIDYDSWIKE